jgi:gas vesicle protein
MRATRAYIASAGTAAVMLGAAVVMLVVVGTFVAFGSWPGESSAKQVDQVLLNELADTKAKSVAVSDDAVAVARRSEARRKVALARKGDKSRGGVGGERTAGDKAPSGSTPTSGGGGQTVAAVPGGDPVSTVRQGAENLTQNLDSTTKDVTDQVQQQVEDTGQQVNQVVDQVVDNVQQTTDTTVQQVQDTVGGVTGGVNDAVDTTTNTVTGVTGGLLGH